MSENKTGFWGSPRTPKTPRESALSSPLSFIRNFASLSNRGSPQSPRTLKLLNGGTEATKTPDKKTPGGSSADDDVENKENNDGASISEAQEVFESNLELAAKTGSEDDAVKAITGVESENKARSSVPFDEVTSVVQSDKISSSPPDEASTAATSAEKTLTPDQCAFSAPQLLPLLDQTATKTVTPTRYEAIASLDVENEDEKWADRTSVITKWQHEEYVEYATEVVSDCIEEAVAAVAPVPLVIQEPNRNHDETLESEMDVSFLSTATAEASELYQNVGRVIVSDDSEYESAGDASFVDTSFLVPSNSMQSAATKPSDAMDALIDGIANFQLITPCVDKPFVKPDFESPTSIQPERESTPVPEIFTVDEEEILQSDKKSCIKNTSIETETSLGEISVIDTPAAGNSNDDSFLAMFASMKVEETKEVVVTPEASSEVTSVICTDISDTGDVIEVIDIIDAEQVKIAESEENTDIAKASEDCPEKVVVSTNDDSIVILKPEDVAGAKSSEDSTVEVINTEPVVKVGPEIVTEETFLVEPVAVESEDKPDADVIITSVEVADTEPIAKVESEHQMVTPIATDSETTTKTGDIESDIRVELVGSPIATDTLCSSEAEVVEMAIDVEPDTKVEEEFENASSAAANTESTKTTETEEQSEATDVAVAVTSTEPVVKTEPGNQSVVDTTVMTEEAETVIVTEPAVDKMELEDTSEATVVVEAASNSEMVIETESVVATDASNISETPADSEPHVKVASENQSDARELDITNAFSQVSTESEQQENASDNEVNDFNADVTVDVAYTEVKSGVNDENAIAQPNVEALSNNPDAISVGSLTPTVARNVRQCFEFQSNLVSTPQDVDIIPKIRPSTPTKRETEKSNVSPDNIKRHLFDSPAAQKPTAVVRPTSGIKAIARPPTHFETDQQLHINNSSLTVDPPVEPAHDESKVEDEIVVPFQATSYNLDALTDPEINPFESRRVGIRNSFGISRSVQDVELGKETDHEQVTEAAAASVQETALDPVDEAVAEPFVEAVADPVHQTVVKAEKETSVPIQLTSDAKEQEPAGYEVEEDLNASKTVIATTDQEAVDKMPVRAAYNLDFLDDPSYNPFETKSSGICISFGTSQPAPEVEEEVVANSAPDNAPLAAPKSTGSRAPSRAKQPTAKESSDANGDAPKEEKKKKPLPPKPWLRKKTGAKPPPPSDDAADIVICLPGRKVEKAKPEEKANYEISETSQSSAVSNSPAPAPKADVPSNSPPLPRKAADNLDFFLDQAADDPNFNPFVTKTKVVNDIKEAVYDDPNFNPFESKSKVANDIKPATDDSDFSPFETKSKVANDVNQADEDPTFNPFETKSKVVDKIEQVVDDSDYNPFETKSKVANDIQQNSPPLRQGTTVFNLDFIEEAANDPDFNPFATKSKVVNDLLQNVDEPPPLEDVSNINLIKPSPVHVKDSTPEFEAVEQQLAREEPRQPVLKPSTIQNPKVNSPALWEMSSISSASNNDSISSPKRVSRSQITCDTRNMTLAEQELWYESQLLHRDKELHAKQMEFMEMEREMDLLRADVNSLCKSNDDMVRVLQEFERTISELTSERERERVLRDIEKEQIIRERDQALHDLRSVERSFSDTQSRYERLREVILEFSKNEEQLKAALERTTSKYRQAEERYERLKTHAEAKIAEANEKLTSIQRARESELTRMHAMQRKAEMRLVTLERTIEEKARENAELTAICDELIAKVGK